MKRSRNSEGGGSSNSREGDFSSLTPYLEVLVQKEAWSRDQEGRKVQLWMKFKGALKPYKVERNLHLVPFAQHPLP